TGADYRDERLPAARIYDPRPAAAVLAWHLRADWVYVRDPGDVWRRDRPADFAVCHRCLPRVYAVAGGNGAALAERTCEHQGPLLEDGDQRHRSGGHGDHHSHRAGHQI